MSYFIIELLGLAVLAGLIITGMQILGLFKDKDKNKNDKEDKKK